MDDEEDVKKMMEFLMCSKKENTQEFHYEEFINCDESDGDLEEIDTSINIENSIGHDDIIFNDFTNVDVSYQFNSYDPRNSLKPEERKVIDSCQDEELKKILLLNRTKNMQLIQLYKKMKDLLIECQQNIVEKTNIITAHVTASKDQTNSTGAWRLAAPYFKDKQLFGCPPNADTLHKNNNNELCTYDLSVLPKWSVIECEKLIRAVKVNYNINQQNKVMKTIQKARQGDNPELLKELENRIKELKENDNSEIPPLKSNEDIDWMRVADVFLKGKHTAFECESFWHIYLHPLINKTTWTPTENAKLKEIAKRYKFQNWDQIASDLGTNRTGFTVCVNYFAILHDRFKKGEFTHQEDFRLLELVQRYKMGSYIPWTKIVQHFKRRTRSQLYYRYTYYLSQNDKRRGKFTDAEDVLLMIIVDKFGRNYKKCCEYLPTRSMVQCKARYSTNLRNSLKKGSFTLEEDKTIVRYVEEHGSKSWTNLTKKLHRARGQIRQRYLTIKQFLETNPDSTIAAVPRRRHKELKENSFPYLRSIADEYRDNPVIPSLDEIEEVLRNRNSTIVSNSAEEEDSDNESIQKQNVRFASTPANHFDVDEMLTNFFCNSFKVVSSKEISQPNLRRAVKSVRVVLDVLKADLDIPENFDEDLTLDNLDVAILNILTEEKLQRRDNNLGSRDGITSLMPPNQNTIIGLRSLLIKFSHFKSEEKEAMTKFVNGAHRQFSSNIRSDVVKQFLSLPPDVKEQVEADRKLFYKRFHSLFKWPAIMTLENPSSELLSMAKGLKPHPPAFQVIRTYSRKGNFREENFPGENSPKENFPEVKRAKISEMPKELSFDPPPLQVKRTYSKKRNFPEAKREKISEMPSTSAQMAPLKLTPVTNRSVLEDLLRDQTKKLFSFNHVKSGGETKAIIKEIPLPKRLCASSTNKELTRDSCFKTDSEEASTSNRESCRFNLGHGECVIKQMDEEYEGVANGADGSIIDDEEDLKKLNKVLDGEYEEDSYEDDMEDLKKLNIFLKTEVNGASSDESFE